MTRRQRFVLWILPFVLRTLEGEADNSVLAVRQALEFKANERRIDAECARAAKAVAKDMLKEWKRRSKNGGKA